MNRATTEPTATLLALAEIAESINKDLPLDTILHRIVSGLLRLVPGDAVTIALMEKSHEFIRARASVDRHGAPIMDRVGRVTPIVDLPTVQTLIETNAPLYIPDTSISPLWRNQVYARTTSRAFWGTPLVVENSIEGFLFIDFFKLDPLTDELQYSILAFARFAAAAVHNAQQRDRLMRSEERYRLVATLTSDAIYEWSLNEPTIKWSGDIDALLLYEQGQFPRTEAAWLEIVHPNDRARVQLAREAALREGTKFEEEYRMRRANGTYCHVLDRGLCFEGLRSATTGLTTRYMLGAIADLTNTYELTDALVESEVRYRTLFARSLDAIFVTDVQGNLLDFNPAAEQLTGQDYTHLVSSSLRNFVPPQNLEDYFFALQQLQERGEVANFEMRFAKPDGMLIDVEVWGSALGGGMYQFVARDISSRKQTEWLAAQRVTELTALSAVSHATTTASNLPDMLKNVLPGALAALEMPLGCIYLTDPATGELMLAAQSGFGDTDIHPPYSLPINVCERGKLTSASPLVRIVDNAPTLADACVSLQVPLTSNNEISGFVVFSDIRPRSFPTTDIYLMDIIGRQLSIGVDNVRLLENLEQMVQERTLALFRTETRYRSLIEQVPGVVYTADAVYENLTFISGGTETLFGLLPADLMHMDSSLINYIKPEDKEWVMEQSAIANHTGEDFDAQYRVVNARTGKECWVHHHARLIVPGSGERFWLGLLTDVTRLKELDELKSQFVATVSHELRTPVSAIKLRASTLQGYYDRLTDEQRLEMLQRITYQADILAELIEDVLRLARLEGGSIDRQIEQMDINDVGADVVEELRPTAELNGLKINTAWGENSCLVEADVTDIARVWRNLISNAIKYTSAPGHVTIYTGRVTTKAEQEKLSVLYSSVPDGCLVIPEQLEGGNWIVSIIEDNGRGISSYDQQHIFTRFFRGEAAATNIPGTGLGLSLVKELLKDYGGHIAFTSTFGVGSKFAFWLPVSKTTEVEKL